MSLTMGMKISSDEGRERLWNALVRFDGDKKKVADEFGCSLRTVDRWMSEYGLQDDFEKMGWLHHRGPPRGMGRGSSVVYDRILAYMVRAGDDFDYNELATLIYGESDRQTLQRIYTALNHLRNKGLIERRGRGDIYQVKTGGRSRVSG